MIQTYLDQHPWIVRSRAAKLPRPLAGEAVRFSAATLHEASNRLGALPTGIKRLDRMWRICGPALTVALAANDNLCLHRAVAVANAGDVLVVETGGARETGYWEDVLATAARVREANEAEIVAAPRGGADTLTLCGWR
jgi:4-hydroxy-4-methyl-2-oxoglutarate aldolase